MRYLQPITGVTILLASIFASAPVLAASDQGDNVHAGVKYLHWPRKTYYSDETISPLDRMLFSFGAYNAGPGNMKRARARAKTLGLDPDRWFGNVEIGMYRAVSGQPASYVRNIYKYYINLPGPRKIAARAPESA